VEQSIKPVWLNWEAPRRMMMMIVAGRLKGVKPGWNDGQLLRRQLLYRWWEGYADQS